MFQIVRQYPIHCQITDGIIGSGFSRLPNAYETQACALKIAGRLETENYESCGDDTFHVIVWGGNVRRDRVYSDARFDEVPF